jgi:hypothetical protein
MTNTRTTKGTDQAMHAWAWLLAARCQDDAGGRRRTHGQVTDWDLGPAVKKHEKEPTREVDH